MKQIKLNNVTLIEGDFKMEFESFHKDLEGLKEEVYKLSKIVNVDKKQDRFITREETRKMLGGVSLTTLSNWAKSGLLVIYA